MQRLEVKLRKVDFVKFIDYKTGKIIGKDDKCYINVDAYENFINLYDSFKYKNKLYFTDMFRTVEEQKRLYSRNSSIAAKPYTSLHLYGKAIDVLVSAFNIIEYKEFCDIANKNKFYGIITEKWHFHHLAKYNNAISELDGMCEMFYKTYTNSDYIKLMNEIGYKDIKSFQADSYLTPDGILGPSTKRLIILRSAVYIYV